MLSVGLVGGLLLVWGCQEGTSGGGGAVVEREGAVGPADANTADMEMAAEPAVVEAVPEVEGPEDEAEAREEAVWHVELRLRFSPGETRTYKVTSDVERSVKWEGDTSRKPASFRSAATGNHIEMTFEQQVVESDDEGQGVVEITIKGLRYLGRVRDKEVLDFDSTAADDAESPLARLIGQRYRVRMTAKGRVSAVVDVAAARAAVEGDTDAHETAQRLVADSVIRRRHEIPALTALEGEQVRSGEEWSSTRTIAFGRMGAKAYERVYSLTGVEEQDGRRVAVVEMKAIPSAVAAEELHEAQPVNPFASMFDSQGSYEGRLTLDLDRGAIGEYFEHVDVQWVAADMSGAEEGAASPAVLKMVAAELYKLERIE